MVANATAPETLAPATAFAVVANATAPETLAPATAFAVVANATAPETLAPVSELNPEPLPVIMPAPVFNVPATLTPVPVTTRILALPTALMLTLPFATGMFTFELPFACGPSKLPAVTFPVTPKDVSVPTDVMFG